jgi:hypothetical protein
VCGPAVHQRRALAGGARESAGERARCRWESAGERARAGIGRRAGVCGAATAARRCSDGGGGAENFGSLPTSVLLLARGLSDFGDAVEGRGRS